ncbi:DNA polymerase III subunit beta [Candidatus Babeliales bacterium]|nr:DNA polymerase III subunit beta [Candidatus Babeliales bacterium]
MTEKFVVEQKPLLSILSSMQPICSKRTTLDATTSILFNVGPKELILKSTDLEISLQSSYGLNECTLTENKTFLVSGKRLFDIVKELDETITFTIKKTQLTLTSGTVNLALNIKDSEEFPPFPERIENLMQLESDFLLGLLDKVAFLIPQNNANPALNGLYLEITKEHFTMTTTDGHCLAQIKTNQYVLKEPKHWLLPRRAILELKKILESAKEKNVFLGTCGNQLVFSGESFNFFTKLLVNPFPEYKAILDKKGFVPAIIDKNSLVKTLRRSSCLLSGQFIATSFAFNPDNVAVSMHNKEVGTLDESIQLTEFIGAELAMKFYAPYLLSGLNAFPEEKIKFYLQNASKPIIFETEEADKYNLTYLVMPVSPTATQ